LKVLFKIPDQVGPRKMVCWARSIVQRDCFSHPLWYVTNPSPSRASTPKLVRGSREKCG